MEGGYGTCERRAGVVACGRGTLGRIARDSHRAFGVRRQRVAKVELKQNVECRPRQLQRPLEQVDSGALVSSPERSPAGDGQVRGRLPCDPRSTSPSS